MTKVGEVTIEIDGNAHRFKREMRSAERQAQRSNEKMRREFRKTGIAADTMASSISRAKGAIVTFGAAAGAAITFGALRTFASFEKKMSEVRAVTGATSGEMIKLTERARELGATTTFSASEVAGGMAELGRAGLEVNEVLAAIPTTLALAQAGVLDLASASDIVTNVAQGFQLAADEITRVGDVLAQTASSSNTDIQQLGYAMSYAAPFAKAFGLSLEEASAAIGLFSNNGIKGSAAGTALRAALTQLHKETPKGARLLAEYGLTYSDLNVEVRGFVPVLETLAAANIKASDASKIFQVRAAAALNILGGQIEAFKELNELTDTAAGRLMTMSEILVDNLYGATKELTSAWEELMITLAGSVEAEKKVRLLTGAMQQLNELLGRGRGELPVSQQALDLAEELNRLYRDRAELSLEINKIGEDGDAASSVRANEAFGQIQQIRQEEEDRLQIARDLLATEEQVLAAFEKSLAKAKEGNGGIFGTGFMSEVDSGQVNFYTQAVQNATDRVSTLRDILNSDGNFKTIFDKAAEDLRNADQAGRDALDTVERLTFENSSETVFGNARSPFAPGSQQDFEAQSVGIDYMEQQLDLLERYNQKNRNRESLELSLLDLEQAKKEGGEIGIMQAAQMVEYLREQVALEEERRRLIAAGITDPDLLNSAAQERVNARKKAGDFKVDTSSTDDLKNEFATDLLSITKRSMKEAMLDGDWKGAFEKGIRGAAASGLEKAIDSALDALFSAFQGGGGLGGAIGNIFGGFRASGGPVSSTKAYVVGEKGPELFMPDKSGHILPNNAPVEIKGGDGGGGGAVVVEANLIVQGHVTDDFVTIAQQQLAQHSANLPNVIRSEVLKSRRRGAF